MFHLSDLRTSLISTCLQPITMAPWVHLSFRTILINYCDEYLECNDRSTEKPRSKLITKVSQEITDIAKANNEPLPDKVEKVIYPYILLSLSDNLCF